MAGDGDGTAGDGASGLRGGADTGMTGDSSVPRRILLVCGRSFPRLQISRYLTGARERLGVRFFHFDDFQPNPLYESVVKGVELFCREGCEAILAVGGGSAIDVAKCIKLYACMDPSRSYLEQKIVPNGIPLIAVPTTAGTGSEATRFAVIYHHGKKQSVTDVSCIPSVVFFDPTALETLPDYQKKAAMLDALCHGIESFWSVRSTEESRAYAREAIRSILTYMDPYLSAAGGMADQHVNAAMLRAADLAGRAIDITQTTAGHAMSYKLTSLYGIAHGHAAALCVARLWPYMLSHMEDCIDSRGPAYLHTVFGEIAQAFGCEDKDGYEAAEKFAEILQSLGLDVPAPADGDILALSRSVNPDRLKNNPIKLSEKELEGLYGQILAQNG